MIGKASEIKTTGFLKGIESVDKFLSDNPDFIILQLLLTSSADIDYFYIIYKEYSEPGPYRDPFEVG